MANYPDSIYNPRVVTDKSGVEYDVAKTTVFFAKDKNDPDAEIVAVETELLGALTREYADNAAAIAAGLTAGQLYRTGDFLKIVHN